MHHVGSSKCATVCACSGVLLPVLLLSALAAICERLLAVAAGSIHLEVAHIVTLAAGGTCVKHACCSPVVQYDSVLF
jgi:hypothetical protein